MREGGIDLVSGDPGSLRLLTSAEFDSRQLMSILLAGDKRLNDKLKSDELLPYMLDAAGNASLMIPQFMQTLCEHAACNYREPGNSSDKYNSKGL